MRKFLLPALALAAVALPGCGQVFNMEQNRVQIASLDGLMRFHTGDDMRWSQPGFDDSSWPLISPNRDWSAQGYKGYGGFAWYRFRVILPSEHGQLGLYLPSIRTSYQVFADGRMVGSFGGFPPQATIYELHPQLVLLPQSQAGEMEMAIRVWQGPHWATSVGGGMSGAPRIGDAGQLRDWMKLQDRNTFWELSASNCLALLNLLYCIAGFVLLLMRRRERLYLWYGLAGFCFCAAPLVSDYAAFHDVPMVASETLGSGLAVAGFFSFLMFVWMMTGRRRTGWIRAGAVSVVLNVTMWAVPALRDLPVAVRDVLFIAVDLPLLLGGVAILIEGVRRRDPDARLLLIPVGLNALANLVNDTLGAILDAGHRWVEPYWNFWDKTFRWPFPFGLYDLSIAILLVAILGVVVLRFARSRHEEDQLRSEREAARVVQQVLVPAENPAVPGFRIESIYKPAGEVGGDFFQIMPTVGGGVLLAIGDVSGKGMPAAMTVSLLIGTVRTLAHYTQSPGEILSAMNQRMLGRSQGGFTTCLVLRVGGDGSVTAANAGHLHPWMGGREIPLENGLPLGLNAESTYTETTFTLRTNTQLTLLTDGVVEARDSSGELFGFERTQAISGQPAEQIAQAAQAFGQEDDITVLTLEFAGAGVAHA